MGEGLTTVEELQSRGYEPGLRGEGGENARIGGKLYLGLRDYLLW